MCININFRILTLIKNKSRFITSAPTANSPETAGLAAIADGVNFVDCWTNFFPFCVI